MFLLQLPGRKSLVEVSLGSAKLHVHSFIQQVFIEELLCARHILVAGGRSVEVGEFGTCFQGIGSLVESQTSESTMTILREMADCEPGHPGCYWSTNLPLFS